jgi:hypothetical protein
LRRQTHRGLTGRALGGFATGGRTYGFSTVLEESPLTSRIRGNFGSCIRKIQGCPADFRDVRFRSLAEEDSG